MEAKQREEIGERIKELRNRSPHTNRSIADYVGVGERSVGNWLAGDTGMEWEHAKKVAELFEVDVYWLWDGKERGPTPNVLGALSGSRELSQLSEAVAALGKELVATRTKLLAEIGKVRKAQEALEQTAARPARKPGAKGK